jgi:phospholipase D1/2
VSGFSGSLFPITDADLSQPDDHISFFSLRGWSKFKSGALTTEQVYIHGKVGIGSQALTAGD